MYYFAYGSNMNFEQMKQRCPSAKFVRMAYLEGYRFVYDGYSSFRKGAVANIIKVQNNSVVWGGFYEIDKNCLKDLDRYEGYPNSYDREIVKIKDNEGNKYNAWVYLRDKRGEGHPCEDYSNIVYQGAKNCGLPEDYIKKFIMNKV